MAELLEQGQPLATIARALGITRGLAHHDIAQVRRAQTQGVAA